MHTILGAGGPIANGLTKELLKRNQPIRLVSRTSVQAKFPNVDWQRADLLNYQEVRSATEGSEVIYLCAGLVYDKTVWQQQWPVIIQNVINAARHHQARLIFFDNIYMYGIVNGKMTETTPYNPNSVKGEVRARVATTLMDEVKRGNLKATIARAPDFYGAESLNSFFDSMVLARFARGERAQWLGNVNKLHNFIYVPDAAKAVFLLGQDPKSDGQIWHLPTSLPMTGMQFIQLAATVFDVPPKYSSINKVMLRAAGLFNQVIKGSIEMYYQYDHDYFFSSAKFENTFGVQPTSYENGITELSESLFKPKTPSAEVSKISLIG
jgi:nucleoside-diphosphate-sugar epimerase